MNIMLANIDYRMHTTDEGDQLQRGFQFAGWKLVGAGYDNCKDVPRLLEIYKPEIVMVHDKRDWDMRSGICFNPKVGYSGISSLRNASVQKGCVVKDAGSSIEYHRAFCEEIAADFVVTYYHDDAVLKLSPWLSKYRLVRTYHTVDAQTVATIPCSGPRRRALVSGAVSGTYPLRGMCFHNAKAIDCDVIKHPGYGNKGSFTPRYLQTLSRYRVHIATASDYNFALRKIIESVAVGTTPVTNLPEWDVLPEIDGALVRISSKATVADVKRAVDKAEADWNLEQRMVWASKARLWYDWRAAGQRLSEAIMKCELTQPCTKN